ncbi:ABC transporter permease [Rhodococcus sp. NPDC056743]|jgi:peptide/nickel transport system permease protein|uniref:ABC transporter permease n=1 Tax=unclassified Rhodococcus (in: high G+C Gram-positive bacteria) TaxID=192944 RepID=UPI00110D48DB|nr:ABC transporter permease [Rhodococcus sp. KBS0724]TSD49929.1 ABC transporter permease [Rhodococcus sp. KBS0724]
MIVTNPVHVIPVENPVEAPEESSRNLPQVPEAKKSRSILVWLSFFWIGLILLLAVFAGILPIASYEQPIGLPRQSIDFASLDTLLGTDALGRSMLSRVIHGAQVSLLVATIAGLLSFVVGGLIGLLAGYFGKWSDAIVTLLADVMLAFPGLILLLALTTIMTPSVTILIIGLGITGIPTFLRLARANTLTWSAREFVRAALNMGAGNGRILFKEILPNVLPPLAAYLPIVMATMIVAEGSLSFLGLGIPPPTPSWGGMINDGKDSIADNPHLVFIPATVIFFTVFALNQIGDYLRHRFDRSMQS